MAEQFQPGTFAKVYSSLQRNATQGRFVGAVIDANGDEYQDLFIGQDAGLPDQLVIQHFGQLWEVVPISKVGAGATHNAIAVDLNNDNRQDLIVARSDAIHLYISDDEGLAYGGVLPDSRQSGDIDTVALAAADINADGWPDIFASRRGARRTPGANRLWVNLAVDGKAVFREAAKGAGVSDDGSAGGVFADFDDDGHVDLVLADRHGSPILHVNDGVGNFRAMGSRLPILHDVTGINSLDADDDGDHDLLITTGRQRQGSGLRFFRNHGGFEFVEATKDVGLDLNMAVTGAVWLDVNNDGYRDLLVSPPSNANDNYLMLGSAQGYTRRVFSPAADTPTQGSWLAADFNRDGASDLVAVSLRGVVTYWTGARNTNHWLGVSLRGRDRTPVGAKVVLRMADGTHFHHRLGVAYSPLNAIGSEMLFGLGRRAQVTMLEVHWPNGSYTRYDSPEVNRHVGFVEPDQSKGGVDAKITHTVLGFVEARNRLLRANPRLRERRANQKFVCR